MSDVAPITIQSNVPLPPASRGRGPASGATSKLYQTLEIGQSFIYPTIRHDLRVTQTYAGRTGQSLKPKKFSTRIVEEGGKRVVRVWRVA